MHSLEKPGQRIIQRETGNKPFIQDKTDIIIGEQQTHNLMSTKQREANEARQNHFIHFPDENYLISFILAAKKDVRELDVHMLVTHSTLHTCVDLLL